VRFAAVAALLDEGGYVFDFFLRRFGAAALVLAIGLAPLGTAVAADAPPPKSTAELRKQESDLRKMLEAHPDDAAMHLKLGNLYLDDGAWSSAISEARAAQQIGGPHKDEADALLAWAMLSAGQDDKLLDEVKPDDREPHSEATVRLALGLAQLNPLDFEKAGPLLRDAVELDPTSYLNRIALARYLILRRELPEARAQLAEAEKLAPGHAGVPRIEAELDVAAGDLAGAITKYDAALKLDPGSLPATLGRADALLSLDNLPGARTDLEHALVRGAGGAQLNYLVALVLAREGKFDEASRRLLRASGAFPNMPIGYYLSGVVDFWNGYPATADNSLARFLAHQPNVPSAVLLEAQIALQRKDTRSAVAALTPLVDANPGDPLAVSMLARSYLASGKPDDVIGLYQRVQAAAPHDALPPVNVSWLIMSYGDAVADLTEIEKVVMQKAPQLVAPINALRRGDVAKAAAIAEPLAARKPDDPWAQYLLGVVRMAQKRPADAEPIFRGILAKRPDFSEAAFNLVGALIAQGKFDDARVLLGDMGKQKLDDGLL